MVNKIKSFLKTKSNNSEPYSAYKIAQRKESLCHDRQQRPVKNNLLNEVVKTVMADQNGFVAASKKEMDSRTHVKSVMSRELQNNKEFLNISTQEHFYNSETNSEKSYPKQSQFGLECKLNMVDAGDVIDLSLSQSSQSIDAEGTIEKVNTETIPCKLNSTSINDVEIEQKVLETKEDGALIQCPQCNDLNNNAAIDLSLRKHKKELRKDTASEQTQSTSYSNASWRNNNVKDPVALKATIKTELEEANGLNQYSKEIQSKYEHNAVRVVENPLALQKTFKCVKESRKKGSLKENSTELKHLRENFRSSETLTTSTEFLSKQDFISKKEPEHLSIALNELIIKTENQDNNQEHSKQTNLYENSYNRDLNTSLDVNIDNLSKANTDDKDLNDEPSIQTCGANTDKTHFSLNKTSTEEIEDKSSPLKRNSLKEKKKKMKSMGNPLRILRKPYKTRQKTSQSNMNLKEPIRKTSKRGRKPKTKQSTNCIEKDSSLIKGFLIKRGLKNLPKTTKIEKDNKRIAASKEFPKPFKLENLTPRLPKPIKFKQELQTDLRNTELYKQPAFQPFVRLKRLSSEEALLIPLKTKRVRKSRSEDTSFVGRRSNNCSQTSNDNNKNLIIHQAFSLNPQIKLKQLNGSHDHSYNQPSRDSCMTTPLSVTNDNNKDDWNDSESKYVNSQELSSIFSGNTDSGVSTSTPRTTLHHRYDDNIRMLLEIAAERAFINNHLKEFGYSPIQFQLYNDFNELNIFLKYLIDKIDIN